jgi:anti-sigma regulatory factor (Ser/Thr protein kinase)
MSPGAYERDFAPTTTSIADARTFVRELATGFEPDLVEKAELVVSESATNAVRHARTPYRVGVSVDRALRIAVRDRSDQVPVLRPPGRSQLGGRGLRIVAAVAERWGYELGRGGKVVWAAVSLHFSRSEEASRRVSSRRP